jgi:MYXO-CTERM domain-containing protein
MRTLLLAGIAAVGIAGSADAANIITFSQTSNSNTVTATDNIGNTQTTLAIASAAVSIGQFIGGATVSGFMSLNATSVNPATTFLTQIIQLYSGNFCITSAAACGGTNLLSGTFTDAAFGAAGGPGLTVNVNNPPDTLNLTSSVVPAASLIPPSAFSIGFTNLSNPLAIVGTTIAPFTASFAGTVSSSAVPAAEPATIAVLGVGVLGLAAVSRRRSKRSDLTYA